MRKKSLVFLIIVFMFLNVASVLIFIPASANVAEEFPDYEPVDHRSGLAGRVRMPLLDPTAQAAQGAPGAYQIGLSTSALPVGSWGYDWYVSTETASGSGWMQLRAISEFAEIWVAEDLAFPDEDPRNLDDKNVNVTDEMCEYLAQEFDETIYELCTEFFGTPLDRDGTLTIFEQIGWDPAYYDWLNAEDNPQRVVIKVFNIVDANYFDPDYPYYVIGFFNSFYDEVYYNRNMIHIDVWRWWQRLGPEGTQWFPDTNPELEVNRPNTYEGTVAHEFQHLIHHDYQPDDESFMNEGCSMFAELICGYGTDWSSINSFLYTPDNSLTVWGDHGDINILADYGQALLWATYLNDHYSIEGTQFLSHFVSTGIPGIDGINSALEDLGFEDRFDDAFHNWRIANLIHTGSGKYNYKSIDLSEADPVRVYDLHGGKVKPMKGSEFGPTETILGYDTGVELLGSYGTDYISFTELRKLVKINFDGDDGAILGWRLTSAGIWWTGMAPWLDTDLVAETYVDPGDPTLTLTTYWDIEWAWDYGFVQVFNETSGMWQSLANEYTTDYTETSFPEIANNLPGLSGWSEDWVTMTFDLSGFADENVQIRFKYMTDPYVTLPGWFISDASVSGAPLDLTVASVYPPADFMVSIVRKYVFRWRGKEHTWFYVGDMKLDDGFAGTECDYIFVREDIFLVVSATMPNGEADYTFSVDRIKFKFNRCF